MAEIEWAVAEGAREIDIVISREHVLQGNWKALYDEVRNPTQPSAYLRGCRARASTSVGCDLMLLALRIRNGLS